MLRALEPAHISGIDEVTSLLGITTANSATPNRTAVMAVRLQDILLVLVIGVDCTADITHRDREDTFPRRTLGAGACPGAGNCVRGTISCSFGVVVVAGDVVGVEGGVDDVLRELVSCIELRLCLTYLDADTAVGTLS
jgi:hypothetical protein